MVDLEKVKLKSHANFHHKYPEPLAKYNEVVVDRNMFMDTLAKLHATMGTKLKIPVIAGKELDLHQFFVQVTSRGGIDKAVKDRKWKEIIASFSLPSTATNASFVLRKYYTTLLLHYEKIYFFGSQGWNSPSSVSPSMPSSISVPSERPDELVLQQSSTRNHQINIENNENSIPGLTQVTGIIDGKFDQGYFVTVMVGSEKMKGVVYPVAQETELSGTADFSNDVKIGRRRKRGDTIQNSRMRKYEESERAENGHDMHNRGLVIRDAVPIRQLPMVGASSRMEADRVELNQVNENNSSESNIMKSCESEQDTETPSLGADLFN